MSERSVGQGAARAGVGFLGAGPVTQAIHLPTLTRLDDSFTVARVMDVDAGVAQAVASRAGAAWTTSEAELMADEAVEVVVVCSPHAFHARQVIAACEAGKRAVLCEKPFAMNRGEAEAIAEVSRATGVPILVGAMHTFDPGWLAVREEANSIGVHTIRYDIVLPPNPRFEDFATEVVSRPAPLDRDLADPEVAADVMYQMIMGLAIHDLPLVRALCPAWREVEVLTALIPDPGGCLLHLRLGAGLDAVNVSVRAVTTQGWDPQWFVEAVGRGGTVRADFTPSYVHAGSAVAALTRNRVRTVHGPFDSNGYEGEWRHLADVLAGTAPAPDIVELIDDLVFALDVATLASEAVRQDVGRAEPARARAAEGARA